MTQGGLTIGHDAKGNLTSDGSTTFVYDAENKLVSASGAKNATLSYDPLGRLFQVSGPSGATRFLYEGLDRIAEYDPNTGALLRRHVFGPGMDEPLVWYEGSGLTDRHFLHADERGSIVAVSGDSGTVTAINAYDEYGVPADPSFFRFGYTGQAWLPELGLQYSKARVYGPELGRFLQPDPVGHLGGMNRYVYPTDPVNLIDPLGMTERRLTNSICRGSLSCGVIYMRPTLVTQGYENYQMVGGVRVSLGRVITAQWVELPASWNTSDFIDHYYFGNGRPVSLGEIGLADAFERHPPVIKATLGFRFYLEHSRPTVVYRDQVPIDVTGLGPQNPLFSLGDGILEREGYCLGSECFARFTYSDRFADPLDGGFEVGGIPYRIEHYFSTIFRSRW